MQITIDMKKAFFDRMAVIERMDKAKHRALSKAGGMVRKAALWNLKRRKAPSQPGSPPSIHTSKGAEGPAAGLKYLLYVYDDRIGSVVVGPVKFNQLNQSAIDRGSQTVPQIMEFGGVVNIHEVRRVQPWRRESYKWRRRDLRRNARPGDERRVRRAVYKPRPFMGPALASAVKSPKFPDQFRDMIIGS